VLGLVVAFLGTNLDGFACLAAAFAVDPPQHRKTAVLAAACAFALLLCLSLGISLAIGHFRLSVAWFGLIPAAIGVYRLVRFIRHGAVAETEECSLSNFTSIFAIVLATGTDNVAVYAPLFALRPFASAWLVAAAFLACWSAGCLLLVYATPDLPKVHALKRYLEPALAMFFIVIGLTIVIRGSALF
jgi:cadmium resistance protein CadD (predicted permease)